MRILIVDDDRLVAITAAATLVDQGHEVCGPAHDVAEAMALAEADHPELALIDIDLEGHDEGIDLARELKARHGLDSVFVSGQSEVAHANTDAALGLLPKPYAPEQLVRSVLVAQALINGWRPAVRPGSGSIEIFAGA